MNVQTILYYRYLMRQTSIMIVITFVIAITISFVLLFSNIIEMKLSIVVSILIWLLPLYTLIVFFIWFYKFYKNKKKLKNIDLYKRIKNQAIRDRIVNSNLRIKCLVVSKNQDINFFEIIKPEIEKQKKLISIKNYEKN